MRVLRQENAPQLEVKPAEPLFTLNYALVLVTQFAFGFSFSTFFILPKFLATELRSGADVIGHVSAIAGIASVLAVPFVGASIDRYGRRRFICAGALFQGAAAFGFIWVNKVGPLLYGLRIVHGLAFTFAFNAAATLVADITPPQRLGRSLGIFGASMLVTNGLAPYLLEPLAEMSGWTPVFSVAGLASLFALILSFFIDQPSAPAQKKEALHSTYRWSGVELMPILFSSAMAGSAFGTLLTFYQPFALEIGLSRVSNFFIGFTLTAILSRVFLGGLADRFGRRRISIIALFLYGCAVIAMAWLQAGMLFALGAFFGLAHGLFYPALNALAVEGIPLIARGRVMSYFNGAFSFGFSASVVWLGIAAERFGYPLVFILAGLLTYLAVFALWFSGNQRRRVAPVNP
ncbi:MAG: MFS transporter [Deltaproteobacteria bacterium]|nr:MFS transporter [Deltaproteobacteria bacterium]